MTDEQTISTDIEFKNFTAVPNVIWTWGLPMPASLLLVYYLRVAGIKGECWQSLKTICKYTGIGSHNTVTKARNELVKAGLIDVSKVTGKDGGVRYYVKVHAQKIWKLNAEWATPPVNSDGTLLSDMTTPIVRYDNEEYLIKNNTKKKVKTASRKRDARLDHPAITTYKNDARLNVPIVWRDEVISDVGDDERSVELWRRLVHDWIGNGWNPRNVKGMLDAYRNGGISRAKPSGNDAALDAAMESVYGKA